MKAGSSAQFLPHFLVNNAAKLQIRLPAAALLASS